MRRPWPALAPALALALVSGCLGQPDAPDGEPRGDVRTDDASTRPVTQRFSGSATGSPVAPFDARHPFEVPRGAVGVNGTLSYARPAADIPVRAARPFALELLDPDGEVVATGYEDVEGRLVVATVDPPKPGAWTFVVRSTTTVVEMEYALDAVAELIVPEHNLVVKSVTLGQRSFYEVNLILEADSSFVFSFNASAPVRWDVHSHPPEGVKEWEAGEGTAGGASFVAPARDVYSILWENGGALPIELRFEVDGKFRIHSHSG